MKIKRFEAGDMNEALRRVKEEFGENAVILSAKEVRPGGFFKGMRRKSVEITAATDGDRVALQDHSDFSGVLTKQLDVEPGTDRVTLTSRKAVKKTEPAQEKPSGSGGRSSSSGEIPCTRPKVDEPAPETLPKENAAQKISHKNKLVGHRSFFSDGRSNQIAQPFYTDLDPRKTIAFVGAFGAGKSTSVAKLAWHCTVVEKMRVALISLDHFSIGANGMLAAISNIMNLPLVVVYDANQLQLALKDLMDVDVVLVDTPGINATDEHRIDEMHRLLHHCNPDEIHLVANATVRKEVFAATAETFLSLGANRLLFSHVEESFKGNVLREMKNAVDLPVAFYTDSVDLFDGLGEASPNWLHDLPESDATTNHPFLADRIKKADVANLRIRKKDNAGKNDFADEATTVVVNRNSELFHHPDCRSVRQIQEASITVFSSMEKAVEKGFKPCQACFARNPMEIPSPSAISRRHATAI